MLELRLKSNAPKRPPRVLIRGPPGSGCATQTKALAQTYGLVHLNAQDLLKKEMLTNLEKAHEIQECIDKRTTIPDEIINPIIEKRLMQSDCKVNGWVMCGFPNSKGQNDLLTKVLKIKPALIFVLEQGEDESVRRLQNK